MFPWNEGIIGMARVRDKNYREWRMIMIKKLKKDYILQMIQLYSYLLSTVKIGNRIMDFRKKHTMN